jgi:hypothetical protein
MWLFACFNRGSVGGAVPNGFLPQMDADIHEQWRKYAADAIEQSANLEEQFARSGISHVKSANHAHPA